MVPRDFERLGENSEYFAKVYDIALHLIGSRRERLAQENIMSPQIVMATMPLYNSGYRQLILNLKYKGEGASETKVIVVEIPSIEDTGIPHAPRES